MEKIKRKYLLLLYHDAKNLLERLLERRDEYLEIFALRRTREHFEKVFFSRYHQVSISELIHLDENTLKFLADFYRLVDDLHWFMYSTQAMPGAVGEELDRYLARLEKVFAELETDILDQIGTSEDSVSEDVPDIPNISLIDESDGIELDNEDF